MTRIVRVGGGGTTMRRIARMCACWVLALIATLLGAQQLPAADSGDWPQFLGPQRDGICRAAIKLLDTWPAERPKEVWRASGGVGMSGLAISGQQLCTLVQKDGQQWFIALDPSTGKQ